MNNIRAGWLRLRTASGVSGLRPHDLRHNFVSILQARGISDSIIMSITGYKTHVMLHRYSHSTDVLRMQAVEGLPAPQATNVGGDVISISSHKDKKL